MTEIIVCEDVTNVNIRTLDCIRRMADKFDIDFALNYTLHPIAEVYAVLVGG